MTSTKTPRASIVGLVLSLFGYLLVALILNLPQIESTFPSNTVTLLGFLLAWLLAGQIVSTSQEGDISSVTAVVPAGLLLLGVITAGVTEEILYRGFAIERLTELTENKWLAVLISVIAFTLPHLVGWNLTHIIAVVIPLGIVLSGLYLWKRNLIFNMIVHILIDLPLVFIALTSNQMS